MIALLKLLSLLGIVSLCCAASHSHVARGKVGLIPSGSPVVQAVPLATAQAVSKKHSKHIHEFFKLFGWLQPGDSIPDSQLPNAVQRIQRAMKEPATGVLSNRMLNIMNQPRCGTEQPYNGTTPEASAAIQKRYVIWGAKWPQSTITWSFVNYTADVPTATQQSTISAAVAKWMTQIPLNIVQAAPNAKADIYVRFASFGANDTRYAYTSMVSNGVYFSSGNINVTFNDDYNWADDRLFSYTAVHEFGHSLGLSHTTVEDAIMYPYFDGYIRPLHPDDKMGIHGIYGWKDPKWVSIGSDATTDAIIQVTSPNTIAPNDGLYQIRTAGQILRYSGGNWITVDNYPPDTQITGANGTLYQRHTDGSTYRWIGIGSYWQYIGASSDNLIDIAAAADQLYARGKDGWITRWSGSDTTWVTIEQPEGQTSQQIAISDSKTLWSLLSNGDLVRSMWPYGSDTWELVDQNTENIAIAAGGEDFYKLQSDGSVVWLNTDQNYWEVIESNTSVEIHAQGTFVYSRHSDGSVWRWTGTDGVWEILDDSSNAVSMVGDRQGGVWELLSNGQIRNLVS